MASAAVDELTGVDIFDPEADLTRTNFLFPIFLKADVDLVMAELPASTLELAFSVTGVAKPEVDPAIFEGTCYSLSSILLALYNQGTLSKVCFPQTHHYVCVNCFRRCSRTPASSETQLTCPSISEVLKLTPKAKLMTLEGRHVSSKSPSIIWDKGFAGRTKENNNFPNDWPLKFASKANQ